MRRSLATLALLVPLIAPAFADDPPKPKPDAKVEIKEIPHDVPYRLTETKHILVRLKLNGKGPFNFILDTGAPAVFITKAVAKKVGLEEDKKGWGEFDKFEIEGGVTVSKAKCRVEDLFQLEGMNGMGLAGVELHGVIGYNVLARFRITYDFTADKLKMVELVGFDPPEVMPLGKGSGQGGLEVMGGLMKTLAGFMGVKPNFEVKQAGFLGLEFEEKSEGLFVKSVLKNSPAEKAGVLVGDKIDSVKTASIEKGKDLDKAILKASVGDKVKVTVVRGDEKKTLTVELGKGF